MINKYFLEDINHFFNVVRCKTYNEKFGRFSLPPKLKLDQRYINYYLNQDYKKALSFVSDYLNCNLFDNNHYTYDFFFKKHKRNRDVRYIHKLIDNAYKYLNSLSSFKKFNRKQRAILVLCCINPTYVITTEHLIYRAKEYLNINISKSDIRSLDRGVIDFITEEYKEELKRQQRENYLNEENKPYIRKDFPKVKIEEVSKDLWTIEGAELLNSVEDKPVEKKTGKRPTGNPLGLFFE